MLSRYCAYVVIGAFWLTGPLTLGQPQFQPPGPPSPPVPQPYPVQQQTAPEPTPPTCPPGRPRERCDNKGRKYPDVGSLANMIETDNTTGARPCNMNVAIQKLQEATGRRRSLSVCMVRANGQRESFTGHPLALANYMAQDTNSDLGVRCSGGTCENAQQCKNSCSVNIPWRGREGDIVDPVS